MGLFTTTENQHLEQARKLVVPGDMICPDCKQSFTAAGSTLSAFNDALGLEGHTCPHCGHVISRRRRSPDGL
jgi:hypothetical protein